MSDATHSSNACCNTPIPTINSAYTVKGGYHTLRASNTRYYLTGNTSAAKAIYFIYDIFGFRQPTLQGADILANAGYLVIMPDLFDGIPCEVEWMAQDTEDRKHKFAAFMTRVRDPVPHLKRIQETLQELKERFETVEKWAGIGYCWGGKLVSLTSGTQSPWTCGIQSSPAHVDEKDARAISIPMMMLASKDEPSEAVTKFDEALRVPKVVETFTTQIHGWMSARADLDDLDVKKEYARGYGMMLDFLKDNF